MHQWSLFITASMDDHNKGKRTEQNLIICSGKSEAKVTNNRKLHSTCCIVKANYWQTRNIAQPLCNSRTSRFNLKYHVCNRQYRTNDTANLCRIQVVNSKAIKLETDPPVYTAFNDDLDTLIRSKFTAWRSYLEHCFTVVNLWLLLTA